MTREEVFGGLKEVIAIIRPHTDLSKVSFDSQLVRELGIDGGGRKICRAFPGRPAASQNGRGGV